jgi:hypothetical protein
MNVQGVMPRAPFFAVLLPALHVALVTRLVAQNETVSGSILDSLTHRPIAGAMVYNQGGIRTESDGQGHFVLRRIDPSRDVLMFRSVGYVPIAMRVPSGNQANEVNLGEILMTALPTRLDSISVTGRIGMDERFLAEFNRRRMAAKGHFFTTGEIWQRNPMTTTELVRAVNGIQIDCYTGPCRPVSRRLKRLNAQRGPDTVCPLRLMVDGQETSMSLDDIPPGWIGGMEVYVGAAQTPVEFGSKDCGIVVVWTARGRNLR